MSFQNGTLGESQRFHLPDQRGRSRGRRLKRADVGPWPRLFECRCCTENHGIGKSPAHNLKSDRQSLTREPAWHSSCGLLLKSLRAKGYGSHQ